MSASDLRRHSRWSSAKATPELLRVDLGHNPRFPTTGCYGSSSLVEHGGTGSPISYTPQSKVLRQSRPVTQIRGVKNQDLVPWP